MGIPKVKAKKKEEVNSDEPEMRDDGVADDVGDVEQEFAEQESEESSSGEDDFGGPEAHEEDASVSGVQAESVTKTDPSVVVAPFASAARVLTTRHYKGESEESESEQIEVKQFVTQPASVSVNLGTTINLGDFQSAKIGVNVTVPCYVEELESAYNFAKNFAERKIAKEVAEVQCETFDDDETDGPTERSESRPAPTTSVLGPAASMPVVD